MSSRCKIPNSIYVLIYGPAKSDFTLPDGQHEQNSKVPSSIMDADNAIWQYSGPHYGGLLKWF